MPSFPSIRLIGLAVLASLLGWAHSAAAHDDDCIADWSVAAPIVKREGLVNIEALADMVKANLQSHIVNSALCGQTGSYTYRLVVRPDSGPPRTITLNARHPFEQGAAR